MNIVHAILLAIIEGLTEFVPVSSTGHQILLAHLLAIPTSEFEKSFEIIVQLGAILAVVVLYARRVLSDRESWKKILAAFIPSAAISFVLYKFVKQYLLGNTQVVLWSLLIGGIIIILFDRYHKEPEIVAEETSIGSVSYKNAIIIGLCQTLALIPGVSRSASTIIGALALGERRKIAVEFSFLLAVPTMLAASGYDFLKSHAQFTSDQYAILIIGMTVAFVTAFVSIKLFISYIQKHNFTVFGVYRILLAIVYFLLVS